MATASRQKTSNRDRDDVVDGSQGDPRRSDEVPGRGGANRPDYYVFAKSGRSSKSRLIRVGAVWNHRRGDGFNLVLAAHSLDGEYVCFPPREDDDDRDEG